MSHVRKLTLQSNASLQHFPDNTGTNYKVRIDPPIEVDPDDVVGLAVIHFPLQFKPAYTYTYKVLKMFTAISLYKIHSKLTKNVL